MELLKFHQFFQMSKLWRSFHFFYIFLSRANQIKSKMDQYCFLNLNLIIISCVIFLALSCFTFPVSKNVLPSVLGAALPLLNFFCCPAYWFISFMPLCHLLQQHVRLQHPFSFFWQPEEHAKAKAWPGGFIFILNINNLNSPIRDSHMVMKVCV